MPIAALMTPHTLLGRLLLHELWAKGWMVLYRPGMSDVPVVDLLIVNPEIIRSRPSETQPDFQACQCAYDDYAMEALRFVERHLPQTPAGRKKLCFVLEETSSGIGAEMAHAALNMACKILFNDLHRSGYTFCFVFSDVSSEEIATAAHFLDATADDTPLMTFGDANRNWVW